MMDNINCLNCLTVITLTIFAKFFGISGFIPLSIDNIQNNL